MLGRRRNRCTGRPLQLLGDLFWPIFVFANRFSSRTSFGVYGIRMTFDFFFTMRLQMRASYNGEQLRHLQSRSGYSPIHSLFIQL